MSCEHRPSIKYMGASFQELSQKPHPDTSVDISLHPEPERTVSQFSILQCLPFGCHGNVTAAYRLVPNQLVQSGDSNHTEEAQFPQGSQASFQERLLPSSATRAQGGSPSSYSDGNGREETN
ncbi:hypothetical protein EI555_001003 [Monodon monoceros]|uniref:Uncharacterized protein n=1 Tax=Monodon monoceros TaxID=40151 RepID=A0A4U1F077_MONMO|nr:hypothetical protein EI555_001003 [Monodon monoceros]